LLDLFILKNPKDKLVLLAKKKVKKVEGAAFWGC